MAALTECLNSETLSRYLRGELADGVAEEIEDHLESCAICMATIGREADQDPFCKTVLDCARRRDDLDSTLDRVTKLKGLIGPLWAKHFVPPTQAAPAKADRAEPSGSLDFAILMSPARSPEELGWVEHFRMLEIIGRGGMGVVFRAEDTNLRREVAIKMMLPKYALDLRARTRFLREARCAAAVTDDHIVPIYHVGGDQKHPYFVMPLLCGQSLEDRLKAGPRLSVAEVLRIGARIANGLAAAHESGLIHRDIKPANVWLDDALNIKILDFGLARLAESVPDGGGHHTVPGTVMGTLRYMSPEQALGHDVDFRSDLYSLGVVLYRLATGQFPHRDSSLPNSDENDLRDTGLHAPAIRAIMQLLDPDPVGRPESARAVAKALQSPTDDDPTEPFQPAGRRNRNGWLALGGVAAVLAASIGASALLRREASVPVYQGHFDFVLRDRGGAEILGKTDRVLGDPGFLAIKQADYGHLDANLEQGPQSHFYLIRIDTTGKAVLLYPEGWTWGALPPRGQDEPRDALRFPRLGEMEFKDAQSGLASFLWLVRDKPLTREHQRSLERILSTELKWKQPDNFDDEVFRFENAKLTQSRNLVLSEHPVRQTEAALLKIRDEKLAVYSRAICYAFRKQ